MRKVTIRLTALVAGAQSPDEPTIRVTVANVLFDVIVTDRRGNPVNDLKPSDFCVFQDNKPRPVVSANRVDLPRRAAIPASTNPPTPARSNTAPNNIPPQRTIALVVDDLGRSVQSLALVRDGVRRFIEKELQPTDRVAIIRTGGDIGALGTLNVVTAGLGNASGRESVILFTDSLPVLERRRASSPLGEELTDYGPNPRVFAASRNAVVIHTVDTKGLLSNGLDVTENAAAVRYPVSINRQGKPSLRHRHAVHRSARHPQEKTGAVESDHRSRCRIRPPHLPNRATRWIRGPRSSTTQAPA